MVLLGYHPCSSRHAQQRKSRSISNIIRPVKNAGGNCTGRKLLFNPNKTAAGKRVRMAVIQCKLADKVRMQRRGGAISEYGGGLCNGDVS